MSVWSYPVHPERHPCRCVESYDYELGLRRWLLTVSPWCGPERLGLAWGLFDRGTRRWVGTVLSDEPRARPGAEEFPVADEMARDCMEAAIYGYGDGALEG